MSENPEFEKKKIYVVSNFIYRLLMANIMFFLAVIPTLGAILLVEPVIANILLYIILFLPVGPALGALVASMIHFKEKRELNPVKDYWLYYKKNWKDSLKLWGVFLFAFVILVVDLYYVDVILPSVATILSVFFLLLLALICLIFIPTFLITIKFQFSFKDLLKLGVFYTITRIKGTIGNACIIFLTIFLMMLSIDSLPLLIASLLVYLLVGYNYDILEDIKEKYTEQGENNL